MDWIKNLNRALKYIEENIKEEIDYSGVAEAANSSKFHFLRVFSILTEKTLGEYIRERRLSLATKDILLGEESIINISLKYRYDNPGAFSKAFKRFHGVTPSQAQKSGKILKATPPLQFLITVKGEDQLDYRIEKKESFKVVGKSTPVTTKNGENLKVIPKFWQKLTEDGTVSGLFPKAGDLGIMGICYDFYKNEENFSYMVAIEGDSREELTPDFLEIPELTWAIFSGDGELPGSIQKLWKQIFNEWFPATDYIHAKGPEIEVYLGDKENSGSQKFEVWIPVEMNK